MILLLMVMLTEKNRGQYSCKNIDKLDNIKTQTKETLNMQGILKTAVNLHWNAVITINERVLHQIGLHFNPNWQTVNRKDLLN